MRGRIALLKRFAKNQSRTDRRYNTLSLWDILWQDRQSRLFSDYQSLITDHRNQGPTAAAAEWDESAESAETVALG